MYMRMMSRSATYITQAIRNSTADLDTFHNFFECWIVEQSQHLQELVCASKEREEHGRQKRVVQNGEDLRPLLNRVRQHYEHYYSTKSRWAKNHIWTMFHPSWRSSLEDAFLWIGGWRPSMAFHLLYSKSGLQFEARYDELTQGVRTGDLGDLSSIQLNQVNELQREVIKEEKELSEKLAELQETVADRTMVDLAHAVTEMMMEGAMDLVIDNEGRVDASLIPKEEGLVEILQRADDLRLKTLREVLNILSPIQGVYFLIAAAELHLRSHEWGKRKDARNHTMPN